jgi:multidrug efflux pump subunit AcrB
LSPALSSLLLKPHKKSRGPLAFCFGKFNRGFEWARNRYLAGVGIMIRRSAWALVGLAVFWVAGGWLFKILPAGFLPDEDQAAYFVPVRLPDGASIDRTDAAVAKIEQRLAKVKGV